jgi:AbrB family looped-hinge helix DNA binding protein
MDSLQSFEVKVSKKRLISIPKSIAEKLGIKEGMKLRIYTEGDKIIIEPIKDAFSLLLMVLK